MPDLFLAVAEYPEPAFASGVRDNARGLRLGVCLLLSLGFCVLPTPRISLLLVSCAPPEHLLVLSAREPSLKEGLSEDPVRHQAAETFRITFHRSNCDLHQQTTMAIDQLFLMGFFCGLGHEFGFYMRAWPPRSHALSVLILQPSTLVPVWATLVV